MLHVTQEPQPGASKVKVNAFGDWGASTPHLLGQSAKTTSGILDVVNLHRSSVVRQDRRMGTYLSEALGKPERLSKKGRERQLLANVNSYLYAVTFWVGHGHRVVEIGKGWVALQHPKVEWKVIVGVSPRFVPKRCSPLNTLVTIYGDCYASWKAGSKLRRRSKAPGKVKSGKNNHD